MLQIRAFTTILLAAVLFVMTGMALAQPGQVFRDSTGYWRYYNGYWYHYQSSIYGYNPGYYARYDKVLPHGVPPSHFGAYPTGPAAPKYTNTPSGRSFSPSQAPNNVTDLPVYIQVRVPANAKVWFDDNETEQTGTLRQFVSPPVTPGSDYTYRIRARWKQGEAEATQSRLITFHAGERISVVFPEPVPPKSQ
jgi:uncharacterized protein (TIGR03000 family)